MSLLWWLPALVVVAITWWRLRPRERTLQQADLRRMQRLLDDRR